jgi:AAA domain
VSSSKRLPPLPGPAPFLSLAWRGPASPPSVDAADVTEATLTRDVAGGVTIEVAGTTASVTGYDAEQDRLLHELQDQPLQRIVMVLATDHGGAGGQGAPRIDLYVHLYEVGHGGEPLAIGVHDSVLDGIRRAAGGRIRRNDGPAARAWLTERLLLPPAPGSAPDTPGRAVISAVARQDPRRPTTFRMHGRGVAVDVKVDGDLAKVTRVLSRGYDAQHGTLKLVHRDLKFTDESSATKLREDLKRQLDKLADGEGFLALWHRYNRAESWWVLREVARDGYARYHEVRRLEDGVYRFTLAPDQPEAPRAALVRRAQEAVDEVDGEWELEAGGRLPTAIQQAATGGDNPPAASEDREWALLDEKLGDDTVIATVVRVDAVAGAIDVLPVVLDGGSNTLRPVPWTPPEEGFLYRSFRGDRRRLLRRREAIQQIIDGHTRIPNLLSLLDGSLVAAPMRRRIEPRSDAAWRLFGDRGPTPKQELALDLALNTPDVVVIQGPPGTGKTQVIAALQIRLAEEGRRFAHIRGSVLLTSFQHAAVDELVHRSTVFGLPANKVDRAGRGATVQIDQWRQRTLRELDHRIEMVPGGPALRVLHRVAALVAGHLLTPGDRVDTVKLLAKLEDLGTAVLPGRLMDQLRTTRARLDQGGAGDGAPDGGGPAAHRSDAHELAIWALRAVRTDPSGFDSDGPAAAGKALRRLRKLPAVPVEPLAVLERATGWTDDGLPPFLAELAAAREALIAWLEQASDAEAAPGSDLADTSLRDLLAEVVGGFEDRVAGSPGDGVALALLDYRNALDGDPAAVQWTLREYTAAYAATCQQTNSPAMRDAKQRARIEDVSFDTVIVDEAARANPLDLMIPLIHAERRIVLVGDQNQLPQMLEPDVEREFDADLRQRLSESLFQRLFVSLGKPGAPVARVVRLDTQFRMHPELGSLVSRHFYDGELENGRPAEDEDFVHGLPGYGSAVAAWLDVPADRGPEYGERSKCRPVEAAAVAAEVERLVRAAPRLTFGVITFYSDQRDEIWAALKGCKLAERSDRGTYRPVEKLLYDQDGNRRDRLLVGTVDAFQGKQFDVVLLSTTRCGPRHERVPAPADPQYRRWVGRRYGHIVLRNRLCVAMSRQQRLLIAVGAAAMFEPARAPAALAPLTDFLAMCQRGAPHGHLA